MLLSRSAGVHLLDPAVYIEHAARLRGIEIAAEHLPGVVENIVLLQRMATLVMEFALDDHNEPAPVYEP